MKKSIIFISFILIITTLFSSCSAAKDGAFDAPTGSDPGMNTDGFIAETSPDGETGDMPESDGVKENPFVSTSVEATSTFSADVDTASYAYMRKIINQGYSLNELKSIYGSYARTEELVNYFDYNYALPEENELFGRTVTVADCPWNPNNKLVRIGLKTVATESETKNNLVFLIDVSGSMRSDDKLGLLKKAFSYLVSNLDANDRVSIVTYSGNERVVLEGCEGNKHEQIINAVNTLEAGGSTNGQAGLQKAYQIAESCFIPDGNNRIIMASDGDLNVGISNPDELKSFVEGKRDQGVYLSVMGFGTGNYRDGNMEALADNGNGVYYYIDGEHEAEKIFGEDLFATLYTVASDVKLQISFNPDAVEQYRLIGYENRVMSNEDFDNDTKDAGEIGAGHILTAFYEITLKGTAETEQAENWFTLAIRHKKPGETQSTEQMFTYGLASYTESPDADFMFAAKVVEFAMVLHNSEYKGDITLESIIESLVSLTLTDGYKQEFVDLLIKLNGND